MIARRHRMQHGSVRLHRKRIYILPARSGYGFALTLLILFLWSINYSNSMGFVLVFLLAATALNAMWRCHNSLLDLRISPAAVRPVFAGERAVFPLKLDHPGRATRYGISLQLGRQPALVEDLASGRSRRYELSLPAVRRGLLRPGRIRVFSQFPLGLFQAWSWVHFDHQCLVYPRPEGSRALPLLPWSASAAGTVAVADRGGTEDFSGLRNYVLGDPIRHVAWKASARSRELLVKQFSGASRQELLLDWDLLPDLDTELRLSQLCQWVLLAERTGSDFALRLPGLEIPLGSGSEHVQRSLRALALHDDQTLAQS